MVLRWYIFISIERGNTCRIIYSYQRNNFLRLNEIIALIYNKLRQFGFGTSKESAIGLGSNNQFDCYVWEGYWKYAHLFKLLGWTRKTFEAQRALTNFYITNEFISNEK